MKIINHEDNWKILKHDLGSELLSYLLDPSIIEIMLNNDGNLWIEKHGQDMQNVGFLRPEKAMMIINTMASSLNLVVNANDPIFGGEIPIDGSRFQAMIPPVVNAPTFSIRKKALKIFSLDDYILSNIISCEQAKILSKMVNERKNILIVGATSSGKTTFANAILKEISVTDPNCRIAIIEDTQELQCDIKNKIVARTSKNKSIHDLIISLMRYRPDRICVGEIRGGEAFSLLMAWNTGHCGGIATVHANNAKAGIKRIESILMSHNYKPVPEIIVEAINIVVNIQKTSEGRKVNEILELNCENGEYIFNTII